MWERTCEKCGGLLRGHGDGGREGNGEREREGCGFGYLEVDGVNMWDRLYIEVDFR